MIHKNKSILIACVALLGASLSASRDGLQSRQQAMQKLGKKRVHAQRALPVPATKKIKLSPEEKGEVVNTIAAVIHVDPTPIVITLRELESPNINGQKRKLMDIIVEQLLAYEGEHVYRLGNSEDSARKYFDTIKKQNNLSDEEFKALFARLGKTPEEGFAEFKANYIAQQIISFRITSRVVISEEEVRAYYEANPEYEEAGYKIKRGFIAKGAMTETELKEFQDSGKHSYKIDWNDPYWLEDSEINSASDFIKTMEPGSYSTLEVVPGGYEVVKLVQKRLQHQKSFDECRVVIIEKLQVPFFQKKMDELKKELLDKYQITYFVNPDAIV